jgi:hypothetical protein
MTEAEIIVNQRRGCEYSLEAALYFLRKGLGDIFDCWNDDAWRAFLACREALDTLRAGLPEDGK